MLLEVVLVEVDRGDEVAAVHLVAPDGPGGKPRLEHLLGKLDLARHLSQVTVAQDDDRVSVLEAQVEREQGQVEHLLRRRGGEDDGVRVAVPESLAGELDVGLLGRDVPETGAASHDVDEDPGDLRACLLYTSPSPRDRTRSRMPSSA